MCGRFIVAVSCILVKDQKVFIAKRKPREDIPLAIWEFPSGRLEEDEAPLEGLVREMQEELGIEVNAKKIVDAYKILRNGVPTIILSYICETQSSQIVLSEHSEGKWVDPEDLLDYFEFENQKATARKVKDELNALFGH